MTLKLYFHPLSSFCQKVLPFAATHKTTAAYFDRLTQRASHARALKGAEPYFAVFPG